MPIDRRRFLASLGAAALAGPRLVEGMAPRPPRPTAAQLAWQRDELAMFIHFGVNTFTDREWGDGKESPAIFAPTALDTRQWARTARAAGFKAMILTAKHHDGFCLWPTATTTHSVASSPWRDGQGDLVREFEQETQLTVHPLIAQLDSSVDWVLVEGFKQSDLLKVEVWRAEAGQPARYTDDDFVVAIATDDATDDSHYGADRIGERTAWHRAGGGSATGSRRRSTTVAANGSCARCCSAFSRSHTSH
ncbi:MAG: hypothetical protein RLZZ332_341 [Actinomycetota bacterium]